MIPEELEQIRHIVREEVAAAETRITSKQHRGMEAIAIETASLRADISSPLEG